MKHSSLGYHTFTISNRLTYGNAKKLYNDFADYRDTTGKIRIRPLNNSYDTDDSFSKQLNDSQPKYYLIEYIASVCIKNYDYIGIRWLLKLNKYLPNYIKNETEEDKPCSIKTTINPKILSGITDYISAADQSCLTKVEDNFNIEAQKISPILGTFDIYGINRVDYCINFDTDELKLNCTAEQLMHLIKQSDIPNHFEEREEYDKTSHRTKSDKHSYYLTNNSVTINCYCKHWELKQKFENCPDIDNAQNVVRFEIQCKYPKVYSMSKGCFGQTVLPYDLQQYLLSDETATQMVRDYLERVIHRGDYYPLETARKLIKDKHFSEKKERRLIWVLELVNYYRGIANTKKNLSKEDEEEFRKTLRDLRQLNINPVTIPQHWHIKRIPDLLTAYYDKCCNEQNRIIMEKIAREELSELLSNKHKRKQLFK